jgi:hypothetical protein
MPLQLRDKSEFISELTINAQRLQAKSVQHPLFPPAIRWSFRLDPNPRSSISQAQILNGEPRSSSPDKSHPLRSIRYYFFDFHLRFLLLPFLDRLYPPSFWSPLRTNHHPISSDLWEPLTLLSSSKPNLRESPLKRLYQDPTNGKTPSKPGLCPQL